MLRPRGSVARIDELRFRTHDARGAGSSGSYVQRSGRPMAVLIHERVIAHDGGVRPLQRGAAPWAERLTATPSRPLAVATDGDTYGDQHKQSAIVLARVLETPARRD